METPAEPTDRAAIAADVRSRLGQRLALEFDNLVRVVEHKLSDLMDEAAPARVLQVRQDAWFAFKNAKPLWREKAVLSWQGALLPEPDKTGPAQKGALELIETGAIESKIVASKLALALMEEAAPHVNELRKRCKALNLGKELAEGDLVHPETVMLGVVDGWRASGMTQEAWALVVDTVRNFLVQKLPAIYDQCNEELQAQGILPVADPGLRVRTSPESPIAPAKPPDLEGPAPAQRVSESRAAQGEGVFASAGAMPSGVFPGRFQRAQNLLQQMGQWVFGARTAQGPPQLDAASLAAPDDAVGTAWGDVGQSTAFYSPPSATLLAATYQSVPRLDMPAQAQTGASDVLVSQQWVQHVAAELQRASAQVKEQASTDNEKALVELVSLMFQAILQEERLPASIRVWFARLQMPVLRLALESPGFFNNPEHPARKLIDHMGSCVLGFDGGAISNETMEAEIKRMVQVIEQYPETGERVYVKVYEEFQAFLKHHLTERPDTQKVLGVAEKIELKETLAIQYTIELRDRLKDVPVAEDIREFLFKTWSEVLAVATVRHGGQHERLRELKKTASDLIWSASAKPSRAERAKVIAALPPLLKNLRSGLSLLGLEEARQDAQLQAINNALADAFMSREQGVDEAQIRALSEQLENLEALVSEDGLDEMQLDAEEIEQLLGVDVSGLHVITEGGGSATVAMMKWLRQVGLGSWFKLEQHAQTVLVQYVWRSPLGHLHLFATPVGESYLMQTSRLASYLEAGLMQPQENETLTTRATRDALARLQAQPDLLLA